MHSYYTGVLGSDTPTAHDGLNIPTVNEVKIHRIFQIGELCDGSGIDRNAREMLEDLYSSKPPVMEALGFQQDDGRPLQWQLPADKILFRRLWTVLCGLFYTVNTQER